MVLGRVNQQLNGTASIDSWSFGWFSGFKLSGIRLADAQGNSVAEVQSVTLPASVPALLGSRKDLGTITIESPKANIVLYADGTNNLTRLMKPSQAATPPAPATPPQALGFDVVGDIAVTNGEISVQPAGAGKPFLVRDLNADVKIESLEKPIQLDMKAALGEERAALAVKGSATVIHAGKPDPNAVEADIAITLGGLDIGPVAALARGYGSPVEAGGVLTVQNLTAQVQGMDSVKAAGDIALNQLALSGGPLGKDQPKFDHVGLTFDVSKKGGTVEIKQFKFDSPVAAASASGSLEMPAPGKLPKGHLAADAQVNLPALAAQLPDTLKLQKGLTIESGAVKLDAKLDSDEAGPRVDASLRVEDVAATNEGKRIALEAPIALALKASMTDKGPRLDDLRLTSSFASVTGAGSMEKFDLTLTSDLEAALREAAKFVDLAGKSCAGQASVALHLAGADRQKTISGDVTLTGLALTGFTPGPVNLSEAKMTIGATALLDEKNALQSISGLKVYLAAPFATGGISAKTIAFTPGQPLPTIENVEVSLNAALGDVARFAADAGLMPAGKSCAGEASMTLYLLGPGRQKILSGDVTLTGLALTGFTPGPVNLSEAKMTIGATALLDEKNALQSISGLKVDLTAPFATGAISAESIALTPGRPLPTLQNGKISLDADLGEVASFAGGAGLMPAGIGLGGKLNFDTGLAVDNGVVRVAPINVTLTDLDAAQGEKHLREPKVALGGSIEVNPGQPQREDPRLQMRHLRRLARRGVAGRPGLGGGAGRSHRRDHRRHGLGTRARLVQGFRRAAAGNERRRAGGVHAEGHRARGQCVGQRECCDDLAQGHVRDGPGDRGAQSHDGDGDGHRAGHPDAHAEFARDQVVLLQFGRQRFAGRLGQGDEAHAGWDAGVRLGQDRPARRGLLRPAGRDVRKGLQALPRRRAARRRNAEGAPCRSHRQRGDPH